MKGKGLTAPEETPEHMRAKNATQILSEVGPVLPTNLGRWGLTWLVEPLSEVASTHPALNSSVL